MVLCYVWDIVLAVRSQKSEWEAVSLKLRCGTSVPVNIHGFSGANFRNKTLPKKTVKYKHRAKWDSSLPLEGILAIHVEPISYQEQSHGGKKNNNKKIKVWLYLSTVLLIAWTWKVSMRQLKTQIPLHQCLL